MRAVCLMLTALLMLEYVCRSDTMSTCKSLDLELVKRKRIEAIRGQILSKLRLPKEPEIDQEGDTEEVPASLMSIYNSTVELSEEQVKTYIPPNPDAEEEAYFAKEVHKFNMKQSENTSKHQMLFNMSEMRSVLGTDRLLSQAELRLLIKNRGMNDGIEQRLELYRGVGDKARYLKSHFVSKEWANRWVSFDVTQTLNEWLQGAGEEQGFQLKLPCDCGKTMEEFLFEISVNRRVAVCEHFTLTSVRTWAGSGSMNPRATLLTTASAPAPIYGTQKTSIPRYWLCISTTTPEPLPNPAVFHRSWSPYPLSIMWGDNTRWSSCPI
ncbi:transforming growth factor beta-1 proprotein isoform X4 [Salvelinus alpinus]|uniref:transforming growth factor beta-1 proprotein isoform X4 n=1 Tax=Salvelinus alpinus TaxID=8036 RepID=UPI0039FC9746